MIRLDNFASLLTAPGPYATAYLEAGLLRAAAGTDAAVVTLAQGQLDLPDGLAVTLRYPMVK